MKTGLVMEGGALRTIFSCGVCDAFLDAELPLPDYFVGVSGGAAYGVSYLAKQKRRNLKLLTTYANDPRYMGWRNLANPKNKSYFGLKFAYETIPTQLLPFDYETFVAYPGIIETVVTNVNTGLAEYLELDRLQVPNQQLIASCSIPLMFPIVDLDGQPYLDGGCSDPIPWKRALDVGCDRVLVLLTQPRDYYKQVDSTLTLIEQTFRKYPAFVNTMQHRVAQYNASREELFAREATGDLMVIAPEDTFGCSRTERNTEVLRALWQSGYFAGRKASESVLAFWTE